MSGQAGILYFDQRPVDPTQLHSLSSSLDEYGPDSRGSFVDSGVALVHRGLHVTAEDRLEHQPLRMPSGLVLTWDGRLDNREDLLIQLWRNVGPHPTDVELAGAALQRWGHDGLAALVGDWALVMWDSAQRTLTMASDYAGNRGLYYSGDDTRVLWASSLRVMLELLPDAEPSPAFVTGYLTAAIAPGLSPYETIRATIGGHAHTWRADGVNRHRRFWDFSLGSCRYGRSADYEEHLRTTFRDAVRARLRSARPVWAEQSGGLDSSSIVCMAARLTVDGAASAALKTVSYTTSEPTDREKVFIRCVEEHTGVKTNHIGIDASYGLIDSERQWITPCHPSSMVLREYELVRAAGDRVLMSGHPGDLIMGNTVHDGASVVEAIKDLDIRGGLALARAWSRANQRPIWHLARELAATVGPHSFLFGRRVASVLVGTTGGRDMTAAAATRFFVPPEYVPVWRDELNRRVTRARSLSDASHFDMVCSLLATIEASTGVQTARDYPEVLRTFPFMHRPLVSCVLSLPLRVLSTPGQPRQLMKRSLGCILPARIAGRISKGRAVDHFRFRAIRAFANTHSHDVNSLEIVKRRYIDGTRLQSHLASVAVQGVGDPRNLLQLVAVETWLRARENRRRPVSFNLRTAACVAGR